VGRSRGSPRHHGPSARPGRAKAADHKSRRRTGRARQVNQVFGRIESTQRALPGDRVPDRLGPHSSKRINAAAKSRTGTPPKPGRITVPVEGRAVQSANQSPSLLFTVSAGRCLLPPAGPIVFTTALVTMSPHQNVGLLGVQLRVPARVPSGSFASTASAAGSQAVALGTALRGHDRYHPVAHETVECCPCALPGESRRLSGELADARCSGWSQPTGD
jgi:hypothetical protein